MCVCVCVCVCVRSVVCEGILRFYAYLFVVVGFGGRFYQPQFSKGRSYLGPVSWSARRNSQDLGGIGVVLLTSGAV